jgi:hypothetical protein
MGADSLRGPCDSHVMQQYNCWERCFLCYVSSQLCVLSEFVSWKPVSSARELQLNGASQSGQEPLNTEAEDATSLEAATK